MPSFLYTPAPHKDAARFISAKKPVAAEVFYGLLPELRGRAFTISGIENANVLQTARDRLAQLPLGGDWEKIKKGLADDLSPWMDPERAGKRAELLLRVHGFAAYSAAQYQVLDRQRDVFPAWQYQSAEDGRVRPAHAALDGLVVPADSPFWQTHFPPWEFGCRCQVVPLSGDDVADIERTDAKRVPEARRVLSGDRLREAESGRLLTAGPGDVPAYIDVRSPRERQGGSGFHHFPGDLSVSLDDLRGRYDAQTWATFEQWARGTEVDEDGLTVHEWLSGTRPPRATLEESLRKIGLDGASDATAEDMRALLDELREERPVRIDDVVTAIVTEAGHAVLTDAAVRAWTHEFLDFVPRQVAKKLPKLTISTEALAGQRGNYSVGGHLRLDTGSLTDATQARRTLWHELTHWLHIERPDADAWVAAIKGHFEVRTKGEKVGLLAGYAAARGKRDQWFDAYAGRIYGWEGDKLGVEVPTRYMELLTLDADALARHWNHAPTRETLMVVLRGLFRP